LIQCKTSGSISKLEWDRLYEVAGWYGTQYHPRPAIPIVSFKSEPEGPHGKVRPVYMEIFGERIPYGRSQPRRELVMKDEEAKIPVEV
jgi:hypothetical protein